MTTFLRDENNNLVFNSAMNLVAGEQAIKLDIKNLLLMFKTEYPFNLTEGIPWYDNALMWLVSEFYRISVLEISSVLI